MKIRRILPSVGCRACMDSGEPNGKFVIHLDDAILVTSDQTELGVFD